MQKKVSHGLRPNEVLIQYTENPEKLIVPPYARIKEYLAVMDCAGLNPTEALTWAVGNFTERISKAIRVPDFIAMQIVPDDRRLIAEHYREKILDALTQEPWFKQKSNNPLEVAMDFQHMERQ